MEIVWQTWAFRVSQVRVSVPAVDLEANLGPAYDDASRILGSGRLPHHGPALGVTSWKKKKREKKIGSDLLSRFNLSKGAACSAFGRASFAATSWVLVENACRTGTVFWMRSGGLPGGLPVLPFRRYDGATRSRSGTT